MLASHRLLEGGGSLLRPSRRRERAAKTDRQRSEGGLGDRATKVLYHLVKTAALQRGSAIFSIPPALCCSTIRRDRAVLMLLAERVGFEPTIRGKPYDDLANRCLQPLGHLSVAGIPIV